MTPSPVAPGPKVRPSSLRVLVTVTVALAYVVVPWEQLLPLGTRLRASQLLGAAITAAIGIGIAARSTRLPESDRRPWRLLGTMMVLFAVGAALPWIERLDPAGQPYTRWVAAIDVVAALTGAMGMLSLPRSRDRSMTSGLLTLLDALIVIASSCYITWILVLEDVSLDASPDRAAAIGTLSGALLVGTAVWCLHQADRQVLASTGLVAAGLAFVGMGTTVDAWLALHDLRGASSVVTDRLVVGALLIVAGALAARTSPHGSGGPTRRFAGLLTPAAVAAALVVGAVREIQGREFGGVTFWGVLTVMALTLLRLAVSLAENQRLAQRLRASVDSLRHQATHDALTGLANRHQLMEEIRRRIASPDGTDAQVGLLFLDVDRFKIINDTLGHDRGDTLLVEISRRLLEAVGADGQVGRLGGDEFVIVVTATPERLDLIVRRVLARAREPITLAGTEVVTSVSIGVALARPGVTADELLRQADLALYRSKLEGRNRARAFTPALGKQASDRLRLAHDLRRGLAADEFEVYYQPMVELGTRRIVGAEALIRWNHPTEGVLQPDRWLDVAEETSLLVDIGRRTLEEVTRRFATLNLHRPTRPLRIAVNLGLSEIRSPGLVDHLRSVLGHSALSPHLLVLEVSEQIVADELTVSVLEELCGLGVTLSIDDFGTGYASLGSLRRLPVHELKIDQTFVAGLGTDPADTTIVTAMAAMARGLGLDVVAEGVTTEAQVEHLARLGCPHAQGFLFGRPQPFSRFVGVLGRMVSQSDPLERPPATRSGAEPDSTFDRLT